MNLSMVVKFALWSIVLLILVGITGVKAIWNNQNADGTRDFVSWQSQYKDIAYQLATDPAVKQATQNSPVEVKQVTVVQFPLIQQDGTTQQRVDRCQSCHAGLLNPMMTAENIIKSVDGVTVRTEDVASYLDAHPKTLQIVKTLGAHPGMDVEISPTNMHDLGVIHGTKFAYGVTVDHNTNQADTLDYVVQKASIKKHPFPTFGCTSCHYGSGRELIQDNAHGNPEHWLAPLLGAKYMDAACAQCHVQFHPDKFQITYINHYDPNLTKVNGVATTIPLMTNIAHGEQLFKDKACYGCHKIDGFSKGNVGPELTYEGRLAVPSTIEHQIWDPRYKVNTCVMPYFFSYRLHNTDETDPIKAEHEIIDWRAPRTTPAVIDNPDTADSLKLHGYIADASAQPDVDALVTFVTSQTGQNYSGAQADRMTTITMANVMKPQTVPTTVAEGKHLFETSGCYACHWIGDPHWKGDALKDPKGKGGIAGPVLTWEGSRHSKEWLIAHYLAPQDFVPNSIMPVFPFSDSQRMALAMYDQSLMPANPGARLVSPDQDMPTQASVKAGASTPDIRYMNR